MGGVDARPGLLLDLAQGCGEKRARGRLATAHPVVGRVRPRTLVLPQHVVGHVESSPERGVAGVDTPAGKHDGIRYEVHRADAVLDEDLQPVAPLPHREHAHGGRRCRGVVDAPRHRHARPAVVEPIGAFTTTDLGERRRQGLGQHLEPVTLVPRRVPRHLLKRRQRQLVTAGVDDDPVGRMQQAGAEAPSLGGREHADRVEVVSAVEFDDVREADGGLPDDQQDAALCPLRPARRRSPTGDIHDLAEMSVGLSLELLHERQVLGLGTPHRRHAQGHHTSLVQLPSA